MRLKSGLWITCNDVSERQELMKMLERRGYLWREGQRPTAWDWECRRGYLCIHIHERKKLTHDAEINSRDEHVTFQEVKDALTRNRQTQRTSS